MPCLVKQRVFFIRQISVMKCQTWIRFSHRNLYWPNKSLIGPTNLDKTGFDILSRKRKGVLGNRYLFESLKNSVFVFSSKTIHCVCLTKQGLCVAKQSICLHQTEPLFEPNRASVYVWFYYSYSLCSYVSTLIQHWQFNSERWALKI